MGTQKFTVLRRREERRQLLKRIAITTDESMVETIDRLASQAGTHIQKGEPSSVPEQKDQA